MELKRSEFNTVGRVNVDFFEGSDVISISKVKYQQLNTIFSKVDLVDSIVKGNIATLKSGIKAYEVGKGCPPMKLDDKNNRIYHSIEKIDDSYKKYLDGENVSRYKLSWNGEYIKYGKNLAAPREKKIFEYPRILVRQIPTFSCYAIEAMYVDGEEINDLNSIILTDIKVNPFYLLGILNSKIITIWFLIKFDKFQRRIFPQFKVNELGEFPVPLASSEVQTIISELVIDMIDENKKVEPEGKY